MNDILKNIDAIRRSKGYSQEYIAMKIGMKQAGFSLIMSGECELKYSTLLQIANVLQEDIVDVIAFPQKCKFDNNNDCSTEIVLHIKMDNHKMKQILNTIFDENPISFTAEKR